MKFRIDILEKLAIEQLIATLKNEERWVRRRTAEALVQIGEPAIKQILASNKDADPKIQQQATGVIGLIQKQKSL